MNVPDGFGFAGRAGRVHPQRDFVRHCRRGARDRLGFAQQLFEKMHVRRSRPLARACADDDDGAQMRQPTMERQDGRSERSGGHDRGRAAVGEQIGVLLGGEQRIDGHGHDAGAYRPPECDRIIDGVGKHEDHPVLLAQPQSLQCRREAIRPLLQLGIGQRARGIHERHLVAETTRHVGVDEIGHRIVRPTLQHVFKQGRHDGRLSSNITAAVEQSHRPLTRSGPFSQRGGERAATPLPASAYKCVQFGQDYNAGAALRPGTISADGAQSASICSGLGSFREQPCAAPEFLRKGHNQTVIAAPCLQPVALEHVAGHGQRGHSDPIGADKR
jgi:hypothetical protein